MSRETAFFKRQESLLDLKTASISADRSVVSYDAMAWNDQSDGILPAGLTNRSIRFRSSDLFRDFEVGSGLSERNTAERFPHFFLESGPDLHVQREVGQRCCVREVLGHGRFGVAQQRIGTLRARIEVGWVGSKAFPCFLTVRPLLPVKIEPADALWGGADDDPANG